MKLFMKDMFGFPLYLGEYLTKPSIGEPIILQCTKLGLDVSYEINILREHLDGSYTAYVDTKEWQEYSPIPPESTPDIDCIRSELSWVNTCACIFLLTTLILSGVLLCML